MASEPPPAYSPISGASGGNMPVGSRVGLTQAGYPQEGATGGNFPAGSTAGPAQVGYMQQPSGAVGGGYPAPKVQTNQPYPGSYQAGAPAGVYGGPPGYQPVPGQQTGYPAPTQQTVVVAVVGACPACRVGVLEDDFTCLGVCCAILCFPLGLICCLLMRQRRCPNCGAVFG